MNLASRASMLTPRGGARFGTLMAAAGGVAPVLNSIGLLGIGINMGNMLEAPKEGDWGPPFQDGWPALIKSLGFGFVRLPCRWTNNAALTVDATITTAFMARVKHVVDTILAAGLGVIIDDHHYRQLDGDPLDSGEAQVPAGVDLVQRLVNIWSQIATQFQGYPTNAASGVNVYFEPYNEPHGNQEPNGSQPWNTTYPRILAAIRPTNPTRKCVIGPTDYNDAAYLSVFTKPTDANVIITVHNYGPISFTNQYEYGTTYPTGVSYDASTMAVSFQADIDTAVAYGAANGFPVYIGEWGTNIGIDSLSRVAWTRMASAYMAAKGVSRSVWNFDADFALVDTTNPASPVPNVALVAAALGQPRPTSATTSIGVNLKYGGSPGQNSPSNGPNQGGVGAPNQLVVDSLDARGFRTARVEGNVDTDQPNITDMMTRGQTYGIQYQMSSQTRLQFDNTIYTGAAIAVPGGSQYQNNYADMTLIVQRNGPYCQIFELLNEVQLRTETNGQLNAFGTAARSLSGYYQGDGVTPLTSYASLIAGLKGMIQAVRDQAAATGRNYQVMLGAVGFPQPFFQFMAAQGVTWDINGFHTYPGSGAPANATDPYFSPTLINQITFNGKPVHINEFNGGDIYTGDNVEGSTASNNTILAVNKHIGGYLVPQVKTIVGYEAYDQPTVAYPENGFGMWRDTHTTKLLLAEFAAQAGGLVTPAEKTKLQALAVFAG